MSPEQVTGRPLDARSDLFTLTIVLAEILTARPLFGVGNELDILMRIRDADLSVFDRNCSQLPSELCAIVRKGLAAEPEDRFPSASAYAEAIDDFVRQKRMSVSGSKLVQWLEQVGLISRSGEHALDLRAHAAQPRDQHRRSPAGQHGLPSVAAGSVHSTPTAPEAQPDQRHRSKLPDAEQSPLSPAIYRVINGESVLGPMPYSKLVELFATGRAGRDTLVSREGGAFRPARDLPELARLLVSAALAPLGDEPTLPRMGWAIDRAWLPWILFDLALRKETGLLVASQNQRKKKFFLVDGAPAFTTSTDKNELLGQQLIARGLVVPMEVDMALALCPRYGGRLGDALVGLGVLRPHELFRALVAQTQDRFIDLLSWRFGYLEFVRGVRAEGETILYGTSPIELIARGVLLGYPDADVEEALGPFLDQEIRPVASMDDTVRTLGLAGREGASLLLIEQSIQIGEIVELCGATGVASRAEALRGMLIGLSARGLVTNGWPPPIQRPSVPTMKM